MKLSGQTNHKLDKYSEFLIGTGEVSRIIFQDDFKFFAIVGKEVCVFSILVRIMNLFTVKKIMIGPSAALLTLFLAEDKWTINYLQYHFFLRR